MESIGLFNELTLVLIFGGAVTLLMHLLRQPLVIGYILTGILAGPMFFGFINSGEVFDGLSSIGITLLLFIVGLELSIKVLSRLSDIVFTTAFVQTFAITSIGAIAAKLLGFNNLEAFIIGVCLALSSTLIIVKNLNDKRDTTRLYAQIAIGVLIIQDLIATASKIFLASQKTGISWFDIGVLTGRSLLLFIGLYLLGKYILPKIIRVIESSRELLLIFALGYALGIAALFKATGLSIEVGALFAGVSLASIPYTQEIANRLKPLRDFFIIIFFISLGSSILLGDMSRIILPTIIFTLVVILLKPLITLITMGIMGYTKRVSFKTSITLAQISEFSLIFIASAAASGLVSNSTEAIISLVALLTFAISSYLIKYDDKLFRVFEKHLQLFERKKTRFEQRAAKQSYPVVLIGYRNGGIEFMRTFKSMNKRFVVVDYDPEAIEQIERQHGDFIYGDIADIELINELHLDKAKLVVSTVSDYHANEFIAQWLKANNPHAVFIGSAANAYYASSLYELGASYVMMPHLIGSEKISTFIKKNGLRKSEFHRFRDQHLKYLQTHLQQEL